jgi:predicted Zn-dependent protease with MMP-like domain
VHWSTDAFVSVGSVGVDELRGVPVRTGRTRQRRGRSLRGPLVLPGPHSPDGIPSSRSATEEFDAVVDEMVARLDARWGTELRGVVFGVEEVPWVDDEWHPDAVPLATHVRGSGKEPSRVVVYRLPVRRRAQGRNSVRALVLDVLVEQVAELLGRSPDEVDPRQP